MGYQKFYMIKTIIVTGVSKGFGKELFKYLQSKNYYVIGIIRNKKDEIEIKKLILNKKAEVHVFDITNNNKLNSFFKDLKKRKIEIWGLINNAGLRYKKSFFEINEKEMNKVFKVNSIAPLKLTQLVTPLISKKGGRIINISSVISDRGLKDLCGYAMSKNSLNSLTKSSAIELSKLNITVNAIAPGFCKTSYFPKFLEDQNRAQFIFNKIPMQRWGDSKEILGLVNFILSDESSYITGNIIPIDGGWSSW